jgi:hypothetical protein
MPREPLDPQECLRSLCATDDAGLQYEGIGGDWHGLSGHAGRGSFWLWPPVSADRTSLRVTVSTLWEAAWAEIDLPR